MLPSDWLQVELTDEMEAAGVFYCALLRTARIRCRFPGKSSKRIPALNEVQAELAAAYPGAKQMVINGIATVAFTDKSNDVAGLCDARQHEARAVYVLYDAGFRSVF